MSDSEKTALGSIYADTIKKGMKLAEIINAGKEENDGIYTIIISNSSNDNSVYEYKLI